MIPLSVVIPSVLTFQLRPVASNNSVTLVLIINVFDYGTKIRLLRI
jgi:hypothetical protein